MPKFSLIVRKLGAVELLPTEEQTTIDAIAALAEGDRHVGDFNAENTQEGWRQVSTLNPQVDMNTKKLLFNATVDDAAKAAAQTALDAQKAEAVAAVELPQDTGAVVEPPPPPPAGDTQARESRQERHRRQQSQE